MMSECKKNAIEIIGLKRPRALDKLADTIPKPRGAIPNFGLPKWKVMPLESKIPMVPGPKSAYNFTRRKIGKKLWISIPDAEFNLQDPYCYEMKFNYDPLHDNHLVSYFSKPNNIRHLIKTGLITKNLDAKCSLRDYNMFRKYLRKLHCDSVKKELRKRTKWAKEQRALQYADEQARKETNKLKKEEELMEASRELRNERKLLEKLKVRKQREKQQKVHQRLQALRLKKQEAQRLQLVKSKAQTEFIRQKRKAAFDIERNKIISTLVEWKKKEYIRKKKIETRLANEQEEKLKNIVEKWKMRQEFQKKDIEKEQTLLKCIEDRRKEFIEEYNEKIKKETARMERLLENAKMFMQCYMAKRLPENKGHVCCTENNDTIHKDSIKTAKQEKGVAVKKPWKTEKLKRSVKRSAETPTKSIVKTKEIKERDKVKETRKKGKEKKQKRKQESVIAIEEDQSQREEAQEVECILIESETAVSKTDTIIKDKCRCQVIKAA